MDGYLKISRYPPWWRRTAERASGAEKLYFIDVRSRTSRTVSEAGKGWDVSLVSVRLMQASGRVAP
ncbi:hypothetical protein CY34DRAFT_802185 [Suillus luteus UH-Slu-Lm8-n1]|uniref:Uncharacterized protein n=1 Tax=Suillus luteus UH-Slu-Lm8-n1 TaxID=930992 RepID=A0A0D0BP73_9AGAM|nr:hypothetical protein CY34DRAFT_802185 [Suillus luteus UH-Slu-Lm8-n1]